MYKLLFFVINYDKYYHKYVKKHINVYIIYI